MRLILKLIKVLNSETEPSQISLGLCFGLIAGLTPVLSPHNIIVLFMVTLALNFIALRVVKRFREAYE